ncbi:hypothetical protein F4678DRAFT_465632 [Xylaria arbuscula]|nr:hypothetical protein F4678DRAFT_465632 [Xylaria arbuscula]
MAAKGLSSRPADERVLAAMMDDLGNHRMEELARDNDRSSRHGPFLPFSVNPNREKPKPVAKRRNSLSEMYHSAIKDGLFDDDDAAGVSGLDPLDGGNAHRINRLGHQPFAAQQYDRMDISKKPKYDPSQPTYTRRAKLINKDLNVSQGQSPRVGSLGGIVPDGCEVRRWNPARRADKTDHIDKQPSQPAGQGHPVSDQKPSSIPPRQISSQGRGKMGCQTPPRQLQEKTGQGDGQQSQPLASSTNEVLPASGVTSKPPVRRSASILPATTMDAASKGTPKTGRETSEADCSSTRSSSWVPPHLRGASESQASASQSPTISRQSSPRPCQQTAEATAPCQITNVDKITSLDAREVFYQDDLQVVEYGGQNKPTRARMVIYELLEAPVCVWELTIENKQKVIRGDIRELLEILPYGSTAYLRRRRGDGPVRSNPLRFSGIEAARKFIDETNFRRNQYAQIPDELYTETTVELPPVQNAKVHKTAAEPAAKDKHEVIATTASGPQLDTTCPKLPHNRLPSRMGSDQKVPELAEPTQDRPEQNIRLRPRTPPISSPVAKGRSTPPIVTAGGSGWDDNDLISFSPSPVNRSSGSGELVRSPSPEQVDPGEQIASSMAEEAAKFLRNIGDVSDVHNVPPNCLAFIWGASVDFTELIKRTTLLSIALDISYQKAAFTATLVYLVEKDGFLQLSCDDQKRSLGLVCTIVRHGNRPIVRSQEDILALRSGEEPCPEAVRELNAFIRGRKQGERPERTPRPVNGHRRSSTTDTMTALADQLGSFSMRCEK